MEYQTQIAAICTEADPIRRQDDGSGVTQCSITPGIMLHYSLHTREMQLQDTHTHIKNTRVPQHQSYYSGDFHSVKRHTGTRAQREL